MLTQIQTKKPNKNKFDLSRESKLTGNMGNLMPCFIQDVIPGDSFRVNTQQLVRFSPLLAPAMHKIDFKIDYFYVPYRLVWDEWKDFITGGEDGTELPSYPRFKVDQNALGYFKKGNLADYFGLPALESNTWNNTTANGDWNEISLLPFRAYQLIYHEYFRDQNVGVEYEQFTSSGIQATQQELDQQLTLRNTNWEKDYFTSALPFLQRGTEVQLPLGNLAPVVGTSGIQEWYRSFNNGTPIGGNAAFSQYSPADPNTPNILSSYPSAGSPQSMRLDPNGTMWADLSQAESVTLNELRKASALQQWMELMARAGSRYREQIFAMFGERIPDYTVQVPQYLGGGSTPIMISEVLSNYQDSQNPADRPVGDMYGHAVGLGDNLGFTQSFDEHGIILGLCRVIPKSSYVQGISKFWQKFDKFDHYFPQFANLGEQEVLNKEIYTTGNSQIDNKIFGYQQRYAEYKYCQSTIAGDFNDNLSFWELSRRFSQVPQLNQSFVECDPDDPTNKRIFAIQEGDEDSLWIQLYHKVDALRPMPYHANPMLT